MFSGKPNPFAEAKQKAIGDASVADEVHKLISSGKITVKRGNDLIFPKGNEFGDYSEPLYIARHADGAKSGHGRTPFDAAVDAYKSNQNELKEAIAESSTDHTYHINVGLHTSKEFTETPGRLSEKEVVDAMNAHGMKPLDTIVAEPTPSNGLGEPTFSGTFSSKQTAQELAGQHDAPSTLESLATTLKQEAVPIYDETTGTGYLRGKHATKWSGGNFERQYFKTKKELLNS
jgi:hypothetical protein